MKTKWPKKATLQQRAATEELVRRLHAKYPGRILSTVLFGSVARGDFNADSDIDVLVMTDKVDGHFKWALWGIGSRVSLEFDVIFNLHLYSRTEWEDTRARGQAMWHNIQRDGIELTLQPAPAVPAITASASR
jgi:predicted nucleotidyltransferase